MAGSEVLVGGPTALTAADVVAVARHGAPATLHPDALARMAAMRVHVEAKRDADELVYGITTGFGALARVHIPPADVQQLQHNLVRSHAAGAGDLLPAEVVRAMMLLRARTLSPGHPGVRPVVAERLVELLTPTSRPAVPEPGSRGRLRRPRAARALALALIGRGPGAVGGR